jgi:hypothetical protein
VNSSHSFSKQEGSTWALLLEGKEHILRSTGHCMNICLTTSYRDGGVFEIKDIKLLLCINTVGAWRQSSTNSKPLHYM